MDNVDSLGLREFHEQALRDELERRRKARLDGLCDYCNRPHNTPSCKFGGRHQRPTLPVHTQRDPSDPLRRLAAWLSTRPAELEELARILRVPLHTCEGQFGSCTNLVISGTVCRTSYPWDGEGENPNRDPLLCPECSQNYDDHWKAMWDEYHSGRI